MKYYYRYIYIAASLLLFFGCDDFLDKYPKNEITESTFWNKPVDLELYCNSYYGAIPDQSIAHDNNVKSDVLIRSSVADEVLGKRTVPDTDGTWSWGALRKYNIFLANYGKVQGDDDEINIYVGETKFFRALDYWKKVKKFGDVPWYSIEVNPEDIELVYKSRDFRKQVVDSVMADLDAAIQYLPSINDAKPGRVHREYAMAMKARIALYEGTWRKYHQATVFGVDGDNGEALIQQAAEVAKQVMDGGKFSIETGDPNEVYNRLFITHDLRDHPEMIFIHRYHYPEHTQKIGYQYTTGFGNGLSKNAVDLYLCADGKPISLSPLYGGDNVLEDELTNRDPRLLQTVAFPYTGVADSEKWSPALPGMEVNPYSTTGYFIRKWWLEEEAVSRQLGQTDIPIFRYAEILLIYAEAKAELEMLTQTDLDLSINILRGRVNMPHLTLTPPADPENLFARIGMELDPIIVEIRRERSVELMLEGQRWDDIMRWRGGKLLDLDFKGIKWDPNRYPGFKLNGKFLITQDGYVQLKSYAYSNRNLFDDSKDYLYPLPTNELSKYPDGILEQNSGWE